ncbi:phage minor head protein [Xanthobacter sp. DSM 24535]|uniref:phage minor head protein n=1 Tax=Roseixanthobacter psychrophilus TaxID=3119917 RepID=UPI003726E2F7
MASNRSIDQLIEDWTPQLRRAFLDAVYAMRDRVQVELLVTMLERGDVDGAIRAVNLDPVSLRGFDRILADAYEAGGKSTASGIPALREPSGHILKVGFNVYAPSAVEWIRAYGADLIREIEGDTEAMIRNRLASGLAAGENPRNVALDIAGRKNGATGKREGGIIGLASSQEQWVRSFESRLKSGDPAALAEAMQMKLRDKRFDRSIEKAIREGRPLPAGMIAKMTAAYKSRALRYRAETISRTEALTALHQSQEEGWRQAISAGQVKESLISKTWHDSRDVRVRDTHHVMNGQKVPFSTPFASPSGARLRYPGDPQAPARERIKCRCWCEYRVDYLAEVM